MWVGSASDVFSERRFRDRVRFLSVVFIAACSFLTLRLFFLQVVRGEVLARASESNRTQVIFLRAPRGDFYDRRGRAFVTNRTSWSLLYSVPENSTMSLMEIEAKLKPHLASFSRHWQKRLQIAFQTRQMVRLVEDVPDRVAFAMREIGELVPGLRVVTEFRRGYPLGVYGAHLVGYLGEIDERELRDDFWGARKSGDLIGKTGLEKIQDRNLRGVDGGMLIEVDSIGRLKRVIRELPSQKGSSLHLTLDFDLQRTCEEELAKSLTGRGAAVVLDPRDGSVLAWASAPTFDPLGSLAETVSDPKLPFFDRVYKGSYPPGSVFKVATAIAGFEKGVISTARKIECVGFVTLPDKRALEKKYACWKIHGWVDYWRAMAESCDAYFYDLGKRLGADPMYETARLFGLGERVQDTLQGENTGHVPSPAWKRKAHLGGWSTGDSFNMAIGQGYITTTPLQMAVFTAGLATRGQIFRPRMIEKQIDIDGTIAPAPAPVVWRTVTLKDSTWEAVRQAMKRVVRSGTGVASALAYLEVYGKTGTAQNPHGEDHAWFIAYAGYPGEAPSVALCVFIENGGSGGAVAAPIAKRLLEVALPPKGAA